MKKVFRFIMIVGLIGSLSAPLTIARDGRQGRGSNGNHTERTRSNEGKRDKNSRSNSGQRPSQTGQGQRPGQSGQGQRPVQNQPGKRPQQGQLRPGNQHIDRPNNNYKPSNNKPTNSPKPNYKPGNHQPNFGHHTPPPPPAYHKHWPGYHRPTPPPRYVYGPHAPSFGSILGMVLGTAFNASLNYLYSNGYNVAGCAADAIYLNNVHQMNMAWPNAILRYAGGLLASSQYIYSTDWNDASRYWSLFNAFNRQYGYPASVNNSGGTLSASWFGPGGRFVSLNYQRGYNNYGAPCFYTTLTYGN